MKIFLGLLIAAFAVSVILAKPAQSPKDETEVFGDGYKGVVDTGVGYSFLRPNPNLRPSLSFGFFDSFDDILRRMRSPFWYKDDSDGSTEDSAENTDDSSFKIFNVDPKGGKSTSTVKIINGHKIEVNETVYGNDANQFKVRVINIRPADWDDNDDVPEVERSYPEPTETTNPSTKAPKTTSNNNESDEDTNERREPLEKVSNDNVIHRDIDDPEVK